MGGITRRFWAVTFFIVLINVVGLLLIREEIMSRPMPGLRVMSFSPTTSVDETDRLVLRFDEAVMRIDQCNAPIEHSPFVIDPAPPAGHWRWEQPDQLVYLLESKLPAGRQFVVRPADDIETTLGRRVVGDAQFTVRTRPLIWTDAQVTASDDQDVTLELSFNQPVRADDLSRHLKVIDRKSRAPLAVQVISKNAADRLTVRFPRPDADQFQIILASELTGDGGTLALGDRKLRDLAITTQFKLRTAQVQSSHRGHDPSVNLWFTRRLDNKQPLPADAVTITPAVQNLSLFNAKNGDFLSLTGNFISGTRYHITASPNLLAHDGKPLGKAQSLSIEIPDRSPMLVLPDSRGILSPQGNLLLDLKTCNIEAFTLSATKLHANNLVPHLRGDDAESTSRQLVERPIKLKSKKNEPVTVAVDLRELLDKNAAAPGVYEINARAQKPYWLSDSATITISDIALTVKRQRGSYHVFATSLETARPLAGVKLSAITFTNQTLAESQTNEQGIAILKAPSSHPDGEVWVITAQLGDDLNFIQPDRRQWVLDDVDQSGRAYAENNDAMLYTERGVYRPGDVVHLTAIMREADGATPPPMPLELRIKRPDGRIIAKQPIKPDVTGQGIVHTDFASTADGQLGRYEFTITLPGSSKALGTTSALIEAFVPIRIEVKAAMTQQRFGPQEQPTIDVNARYLFGQPASGLPLVVSPSLKSIPYQSKRHADFTFETGEPAKKIDVDAVQETLDSKGKSKTSFALPQDSRKGLWQADVAATVTEPGGRSVSQNTTAIIDTIDRHIGLRLASKGVIKADTASTIDWCLVTGSDADVKPQACRVLLERIEYYWVLEQVDGNAVWKSWDRSIVIKDEAIDITGDAPVRQFAFTCREPGNHRLTIIEENSGARAQVKFYVAHPDDHSTSPPVTSPQRVELVLDRKSYSPGSEGETAKIIVRSPFAGTLLLTIETDRVIEERILNMEQNTATIELPVDSSIRGGAFITATVIRPLDRTRDKWLPHRAMGIARLSTDHTNHELPLAITAPDRAEPGESVTIQIESAPQAREGPAAVAHVWAVDDGILLTTSHPTPDPLKYFFAPRAGAVATSDLFADLLPDHQRPAGMTRIGAGDDGEGESLRRSPVPMKQRDAAVIWQTAQPLDAEGRLQVHMVMPRITGRMRVMAVVVSSDQYASKQHKITLASPLLVETSWPRFAAPGDVFDVPVKLFNTTQQPLEAKLTFESTGPITLITTETDRKITLEPNQPKTLWIKAKTTGLGEVKAIIHAAARSDSLDRDLTAFSDATFAVRPITPLHVESNFVRLKAGESLDLKPDDRFEPDTARMTVSISGQPQVELRPALEQLLDYPYGCLEQTTSRLMAMLHAPQLLAMESSDDVRIDFAKDAIAAGIARLRSMQTRTGGLSYWPGSTHPTLWGTTYASLFLVQAQRAGHRVDSQFIDDLTQYLASQLTGSDSDSQSMNANLRAMICHVLTAWDHAPHGWIARLSERTQDLDIAGRAHLAAAWHELGRNDRALSVLPIETMGISVKTSTHTESLTSATRQDAVLLQTLLDIDRQHLWIPQLVTRIEARRQRGYWHTTMDNASALAALAMYQLGQPRDVAFTGRVLVGDEQPVTFDHTMTRHLKLAAKQAQTRIETQGRGDAFVTITTQGLLKDSAIAPYSRGLKLERRWLNREGQPIDPLKLKVGDLIRVEVEIAAPDLADSESIANLAIVDALPAAVEVENPRLATSLAEDQPATAAADRVEFLDDRVVIFASATKQPQTFRYLLRVTTQGRFALPPAQASCMYDPQYAAMGPRGEVIVTKP